MTIRAHPPVPTATVRLVGVAGRRTVLTGVLARSVALAGAAQRTVRLSGVVGPFVPYVPPDGYNGLLLALAFI